VSGHSLGAAMAQYFIEDAQFQNDPHFQARAWTIGSTGADNDSYPDARITNFVHPGDPIRWVPSITRSPLADKIAFIPALTGFLLAAGVGPLDAAELARKVVSWALPNRHEPHWYRRRLAPRQLRPPDICRGCRDRLYAPKSVATSRMSQHASPTLQTACLRVAGKRPVLPISLSWPQTSATGGLHPHAPSPSLSQAVF
jgi:hypothetical protein